MTTTTQKQAIKKVENLLTARRNGNPKREQIHYINLRNFCEEHNLDMSSVITEVTEWLKVNSVAASMNGLV